jgi:hypothetical protein
VPELLSHFAEESRGKEHRVTLSVDVIALLKARPRVERQLSKVARERRFAKVCCNDAPGINMEAAFEHRARSAQT